MQLQDLEIYAQLYKLRSINQTALSLGFAQSNISARLKAIEAEFDAPLFTRTPQGIVPTAAGDKFSAYAQQVLTATRAVRKALHPAAAKPEILMSSLLFDALVVQQNRYDLDAAHYTLMSSTAMAALTTCTAATVVTYAPFHVADYALTDRGRLDAAFLQAPGIAPERVPVLVNADRLCPFRRRSLKFVKQDRSRVQEIDSWASILQLVESGRGVALLPRYLAAKHHLVVAWPAHHYQVPYATWTRR